MNPSQATSVFQLGDWVIVAMYFLLLAGITWWVIRKNKDTADDYFLAGRNLGWFIIGASIFASNIGSEHLVGLAGSGCTDGVAMAHYELHAWCLLVLGWVMVPFYMRSKVFTMPEFLEKRYSPTARTMLSVISLVAYTLTKISVGIYAGGIVFSTLFKDFSLNIGILHLDSFWIGSILVIILTGIYTILGGLRAVAFTEAIQTIILILGSVLVTLFGLKALGGDAGPGIAGFFKGVFKGVSELKSLCGSDKFNLWKPLVPEGVQGTWAPIKQAAEIGANGVVLKKEVQAWYFNGNYPWLGMLFCAPIIGLWYWCTDQYIVQRALGAPNERMARRGSIFASFLKLLPVFIFIIPGMICFALATSPRLTPDMQGKVSELKTKLFESPDEIKNPLNIQPDIQSSTQTGNEITNAPVKPREVNRDNSQKAFPLLVQAVLPPYIRGLVVAGLLAALMSSLAGAFNASSTLFTMDFYSRLRRKASQHQLVWVGRVATAVMVLIGLAWIPVIRGGKGLYDYLQTIQGYLAPPIFVVFFFGVFNKRLNSKGCLSALIVGFILGLFRLIIDTPVKLKLIEEYSKGSFWWVMNNIYFQYFSIIITVVCILVMFIVSYMSTAPSYKKISGLTYGTVTHEHRKESRSTWKLSDVLFSVLVVLIIIAVYLTFTG